jgi:ABC-type nitrate/sulfonate/bicarbonate transport system substrate-binding protein
LTGIKNWLIAVLLFLMALPSAAYCQKLRVGTLYIGSTMLPLWIAREEGYFASRGFDVELIWLQSTLSTMALIAGEAVRPSVTFEGFVDHTLLKEARLQQEKNSR